MQPCRRAITVRLRAVLMPPPGPVTPGGFDYGRMLWFERIGAVGFIISPPHLMATARWRIILQRTELGLTALRDRLTARMIAGIPGDAGVLAAALMTGDRAGISDPVNVRHEKFRAGASVVDIRPAYGHGGGHSVFFAARGAGADRAGGVALSNQEMVGGFRDDRARFCIC